jgi:uncharacterized protein YdhG (YjbR/CyaY superfamily)
MMAGVRLKWTKRSERSVDTARIPSSVDDYIAGFPPETRRLLEELRAIIKAAVPGLTERISYRMPTLDLDGRPLIYFAGFTRHVSVYPVIGPVAEALEEELRPFKHGRGTVRFPLDRPLPAALVSRIVQARAAEIGGHRGRRSRPVR